MPEKPLNPNITLFELLQIGAAVSLPDGWWLDGDPMDGVITVRYGGNLYATWSLTEERLQMALEDIANENTKKRAEYEENAVGY